MKPPRTGLVRTSWTGGRCLRRRRPWPPIWISLPDTRLRHQPRLQSTWQNRLGDVGGKFVQMEDETRPAWLPLSAPLQAGARSMTATSGARLQPDDGKISAWPRCLNYPAWLPTFSALHLQPACRRWSDSPTSCRPAGGRMAIYGVIAYCPSSPQGVFLT